MQTLIDTLARELSQALHAYLTKAQVQAVVERNRAETFAGVHHSHDFCDANVVICESFLRHGMDPAAEGGMDHYSALWDQAWNLAKSRDFRIAG